MAEEKAEEEKAEEGKGGVEHVGDRIVQEMSMDAPVDAVWKAWTDAGDIARWFVDRADGVVEEGETFTWFWDHWGYEVPHEVVVAEAPYHLVLRSQWTGGAPSILEVTLEGDDGSTRVRVVHSGFDRSDGWDEEYEGTRSGWRGALGVLKAYVEGHGGRERTQLLLERPADFEYPELRPLFMSGPGLERWLADEAEVGEEGGPVRLRLRDGGTITGRLLSATDYEAAVEWTEEDAVLELKAFAHGDTRLVSMRVSGWDRSEGWADDLRRRLTPALDRLVEVLGAG